VNNTEDRYHWSWIRVSLPPPPRRKRKHNAMRDKAYEALSWEVWKTHKAWRVDASQYWWHKRNGEYGAYVKAFIPRKLVTLKFRRGREW